MSAPGSTKGPETATITALGDLSLSGLKILAPRGGYALRLGAGQATLQGLTVRGADKAAIYLAHGSAALRNVAIQGGEYNFLAEQPTDLTVRDCSLQSDPSPASGSSASPTRAGLAVVGGTVAIEHSNLVGPFSEAAVTLIHDRQATLRDNQLRAVGAMGVKVTNGSGSLHGNRIAGARSDSGGREGDGVFAFGSQVALDGDQVADCQGSALALLDSRAELHGLRIVGPGEAGIYVDRTSTLRVSDSEIRGTSGGLLIEAGGQGPAAGLRFVEVRSTVVSLPK